MSTRRSRLASGRGVTLIYMAIFITTGLLFTGLAVDTGRAYVVKAQLTKAVDGAALAAARNLNGGNPAGEAARDIQGQLPDRLHGHVIGDGSLFRSQLLLDSHGFCDGREYRHRAGDSGRADDVHDLGGFSQVTVNGTGEAQRRMVDLSFVLDVSGLLRRRMPWRPRRLPSSTRSMPAATAWRSSLTATVLTSSSRCRRAAASTRRDDRPFPLALPGGWTPMGEGLYRGWDEVRSVPSGQQSGLRVIVLFTDGSANGVPGLWDGSGFSKSVSTSDFPHGSPDPGNITTDNPVIQGLYNAQTGVRNPSYSKPDNNYFDGSASASMRAPANSTHSYHRSAGIPTSFPFQSNTLRVDGGAQSSSGPVELQLRAGQIPGARAQHPQRRHEPGGNHCRRRACRHDRRPADPHLRHRHGRPRHVATGNPAGDVGKRADARRERRTVARLQQHTVRRKVRLARTAADVAPAFQQLQNQIVRLNK